VSAAAAAAASVEFPLTAEEEEVLAAAAAAAAVSVEFPLNVEEEEVLAASAVTEELEGWICRVVAGVMIESTVLVATGVIVLEVAVIVGIGCDSLARVKNVKI